MAFSSNFKRRLLEKDSKLLVKSVAQFEEKEENFQICLDYILSNLLYHSFLDVDSHKVNHSIKGLYEKFLIHSDLEKANAFKNVTEKLLLFVNKKYGFEKEIGYSVLALLLYLSESSSTDVVPLDKSTSPSSIEDDSTEIDWSSYLREGDEKCVFSDSSSENFTSDDESVNEIVRDFLPLPPRDDSGLGISPDSCSGGSHPQFNPNISVLPVTEINGQKETDVKKDVFYPYWISQYQQIFSPNPYKLITVNFTKEWEQHAIQQDPLLVEKLVKKVLIHERNVIKEILWMLSGNTDLYIFHWDGNRFSVNQNVHLCNLTSLTFGKALGKYCEYGTKKVSLQNYLLSVLSTNPRSTEFCRTYHAYAAALQEQLQKVTDVICDLEKRLRKKKETFTLLDLEDKLKSSLNDLDTIYHIRQYVSNSISECSSFGKTCRLLQILWLQFSLMSLKEQTCSVKIVLTIFLKACRPFFSFLENLMIHGHLVDFQDEFLCTRRVTIQVTDVNFWESGLILKKIPADIQEDFFLKPFLNDIIIAGKSIEIFNKVNALQKIEPFRLNEVPGELYSKFIHVLYKLINKKSVKKLMKTNHSDVKEDIIIPKDPLLEERIFSYQNSTGKFFRPKTNPAYISVKRKSVENLFTQKHELNEKAIDSLESKSLKPLNINILKSFDVCMQYAYYPTCRRLIKSLREEYGLINHMNVMQKYFLMESGDVMFSFYSKVFEKIFYCDSWQDVSFLYCALQNAVSEIKDGSESLCIFLDSSNCEIQASQPLSYLNTLQLSYEVEWPISIMLGPSSQNQYCQIFSFLLQIKCAKYLLDELFCINLYDDKPQSKSAIIASKSVFPKTQKIHGMYILRMRLMFFVNGLHNYIMTRILHSFGLEFNENLESAKTVEDLIVAHNGYLKSLHERCFLDRRLPYLKEKIMKVLNLCYTFQQLWVNGVDSASLEDLEAIENEFSNLCNFLSCYFHTTSCRGVYFHLESLASSMLSDTHTLHVFGKQKI